MIQCAKESHEKKSTTDEDILWSKMLCNTPFIPEYIKGYCWFSALSKVTNDDIKEGLAEQGVTDVRRITVHRDSIVKPTNAFVLTFYSPNLPTVFKIGFMQVKVDVYIRKIVSEYDQEIPQSQTADNPVAPPERAAQPSRDTRKTN